MKDPAKPNPDALSAAQPPVLRGVFTFDELGKVVSMSFEPIVEGDEGKTLAARAAYRLGRASTDRRFVLPGIDLPTGPT